MATGALTSGLHQGRALAVDLDPRPPGLKNEGRHDQGRAQHDGDEDTPKRHGPLLVNPPEPRAVSAESASNTRKPRRRWLAHLGQTRGVPSSGCGKTSLSGGWVGPFHSELCDPRDSKPRKTQCNALATAGQEPGPGSHIPLQVPAGNHIEGWQTSS